MSGDWEEDEEWLEMKVKALVFGISSLKKISHLQVEMMCPGSSIGFRKILMLTFYVLKRLQFTNCPLDGARFQLGLASEEVFSKERENVGTFKIVSNKSLEN